MRKTGPVILMVSNTTWYIYNFRGRLISALIEAGYEVIAFSPRDSYVSRVEALGARHVHLELDNAGTNPVRDLAAVAGMIAVLRRERPEVLLTYTPKVNIYISLAARIVGIPVIANVSGLGRAFITGGWLKAVARLLYRAALRHPSLIFFQNEEDRAEFVKAGLVTFEKTKRLPGSGVNVDRFCPRARDDGEQSFVFLLAARLLWDKGVGEFVEAARRLKCELPNAEFRLMGFLDVLNPSAISREQVEQWTAEGVVRYMGVTDDMPAAYAGADCVVLPSYREGMPRTLLEAASMGLPIITTDTTGCRDTVEDGVTGFLCQLKDAHDLADKMRRMLMLSDEKRIAMGCAGREKMLREAGVHVYHSNAMAMAACCRLLKNE